MKTSIYKPKLISKLLLIVFALCVILIFYYLVHPLSGASLIMYSILCAILLFKFSLDRIEIHDHYIYRRNAYMNKRISLDKIENIEYKSHWYSGDSAVITFKNRFNILNTMHITCDYNVEEIVEEIQSRQSRIQL